MSTAAPSTLSIDVLVDATPPERDRYVDFLRALSIGVVVCWHWVLSVTYWNKGSLTMPNPVGDVPLLWALTWFLQIMPVFFFVGGYANAATWEAGRRNGDTVGAFYRRRLNRLCRPLVAFLLAWTTFEVLAHIASPGYRGILQYGIVVFVPLWFLGVYMGVVLLTPLTAALHRTSRALALVGFGSAIALSDLARFHYGMAVFGYVNSALVWLFAHQLGYFYRDGTLARIGRQGQAAIALGGFTALVLLTGSGLYPHSMVSVGRDPISNMFPTTACIAALAVFQVGVTMLIRPTLSRWLERRSTWRVVVLANSVAMTVFLWHMTALLIVIGALAAVGLHPLSEPTTAWWLQRPLWLAGPGVVLAGFVALFGRIEAGSALRKGGK
jgi:surface polysaccharide O-acyltransferase-like enzyme